MTGGASRSQKGEAAELRNSGRSFTQDERSGLNEIVHSGDVTGRFSQTPNRYHDLSNSYDPKADSFMSQFR